MSDDGKTQDHPVMDGAEDATPQEKLDGRREQLEADREAEIGNTPDDDSDDLD